MKKRQKAGLLLAVFSLAACHESQPESKTEDKTGMAKQVFSSNKLTPVQLDETVKGDQEFFFLDVRSAEEIATLGTLKGYVNIPIDELKERLTELPKDIPIVTA